MKSSYSIALLLPLLSTIAFAASPAAPTGKEDKPKSVESFKPCQTRSPYSGSFFDLTPLQVLPPEPEEPDEDKERRRLGQNDGHLRAHKQQFKALQDKDKGKDVDEGPKSWHARGYDYNSNFTMNFCGPVVEEIKDVVGVDEKLWQNVSAYYTVNGKVFSIGQQNANLILRGRKLTLNYTGGSYCPKVGHEDKPQDEKENQSQRRKSTLISLLCERSVLAPKVSVAFLGAIDECTYFFEARTSAACNTLQVEKQQVGPSGVFGLIFGIAFLVYIIGGIVYQRAVMHQRGWRQLPNYALWHGIVVFVKDCVIILFSSCMRCMRDRKKSGRGYNQVDPSGDVNGYANARGRPDHGRRSGELDENRLIDELDEEWHD